MLIIVCPHCGPRGHVEFTYGGDAARQRPVESSAPLSVWIDYVYSRDNPRGSHREYWQHSSGCRAWLVVERDTFTHEIAAVRDAREKRA